MGSDRMTGYSFHKPFSVILPHHGELEEGFQCNSKGGLSCIKMTLKQNMVLDQEHADGI